MARSARSGGPKYPEFPGCHPVRISRSEIKTWEGRIEFWDADTEIAMVCEPTTWYHEVPAQRLVRLAGLIAAVRGAQIEAAGASDLLLRNARREWWRIMQPDQMLFLDQQQAEPEGLAVEVGLDRLPDVVLEVDNTTDVRRGKLGLYEAWGFPEVWVEVPEHPAPSRPASLRSGLTIHLASEGGFRQAEVSRAFPGWTAAEIHTALNEPAMSAQTVAALRRVGRAMGEAEGAGPEDDLFLREERAEARTQAKTEMLQANVQEVLESRGWSVTAAIRRQLSQPDLDPAAAIQAALSCRSEEDFLLRIRAARQ
ncbi:MAG: Uma2 family endonuclease [Gammaproteobacteria bacterium]|nr:Uma2 family endonuclease [Gammaproteobacteria bacterium]